MMSLLLLLWRSGARWMLVLWGVAGAVCGWSGPSDLEILWENLVPLPLCLKDFQNNSLKNMIFIQTKAEKALFLSYQNGNTVDSVQQKLAGELGLPTFPIHCPSHFGSFHVLFVLSAVDRIHT